MINLALDVITGMKRLSGKPAILDDDIIRQQAVEAFLNDRRRQIGGAEKIGHLTQSMHSRVGSARTIQRDLPGRHGPKGLFDFLLYRAVLLLSLPAMIPGAVVFDDDFKI